MKNTLHIALVFLLGLSVLAGCHREGMPGSSAESPELLTKGPVQVNFTISIQDFDQDEVITKADYVDVDAAYRYDYEKKIKDYKVLVFDATGAYKVEDGKYVFDRMLAKRLSSDEEKVVLKTDLGTNWQRIELKLNDTYKSLAVIVLANMGATVYTDASIPGKGSSLLDVVNYLKNKNIDFETDQTKYLSGEVAIPMQGYKVYGSWEGLSSSAPNLDELKEKQELKYYKGMSTPLTVKGFRTAEELNNYANITGAVRETDNLPMTFAMARLHVRYSPKTGQPSGTPQAGQASVEITRVRLHNYDKKLRILPGTFADGDTVSPFSTVDDVIDLQGSTDPDVEFIHPKATDNSWVAYVPDQKVKGDKPSAPVGDPYTDPYLIVDVKVTDKGGKVVEFTFERDQITRKWKWTDALSVEHTETVTYKNSPWTEWLQMQNIISGRKKPDGTTDVALKAYYNLVRGYTYEWIAEGVEGMTDLNL